LFFENLGMGDESAMPPQASCVISGGLETFWAIGAGSWLGETFSRAPDSALGAFSAMALVEKPIRGCESLQSGDAAEVSCGGGEVASLGCKPVSNCSATAKKKSYSCCLKNLEKTNSLPFLKSYSFFANWASGFEYNE
jgi:hypothetical protein